jgi:hypothetical protein
MGNFVLSNFITRMSENMKTFVKGSITQIGNNFGLLSCSIADMQMLMHNKDASKGVSACVAGITGSSAHISDCSAHTSDYSVHFGLQRPYFGLQRPYF